MVRYLSPGMDVGNMMGGPVVKSVSPATGGILSGLLVTVSGSGFKSSGVQVSFGGILSSLVVVIDDNTLTAILPGLLSIGPKTVSVSTSDGDSGGGVTFLGTLT